MLGSQCLFVGFDFHELVRGLLGVCLLFLTRQRGLHLFL